MIKTALLALTLLATLATESQARPRIFKVLEEVAVAAVTPPPVYYIEQPQYYYREPRVVYYREPRVVYYSQPQRCYDGFHIIVDRCGNKTVVPARW